MFRLEKGAAIRQIRSYFDYTSPHCDLDLEDSEPTFRTDTPVPDAAPQRQVWPQQGHRIRKCRPDKHSLTQEQSSLLTGHFG